MLTIRKQSYLYPLMVIERVKEVKQHVKEASRVLECSKIYSQKVKHVVELRLKKNT